jgi:hypothetical protein
MQTRIIRVSARSEEVCSAPAPGLSSAQSPAAGVAQASARQLAAGWAPWPALPQLLRARIRHIAATIAMLITVPTIKPDWRLITPLPIDHVL